MSGVISVISLTIMPTITSTNMTIITQAIILTICPSFILSIFMVFKFCMKLFPISWKRSLIKSYQEELILATCRRDEQSVSDVLQRGIIDINKSIWIYIFQLREHVGRQITNPHDQKVDRYGRMIDRYGQMIDHYGLRIDSYGRPIDPHERIKLFPIQAALRYGNSNIILMLLKNGAKFKCEGSQDSGLLKMIKESKNDKNLTDELIILLESKDSLWSKRLNPFPYPISYEWMCGNSIVENNLRLLSYLLGQKSNFIYYRKSLLEIAISHRRVDAFRLLISKGFKNSLESVSNDIFSTLNPKVRDYIITNAFKFGGKEIFQIIVDNCPSWMKSLPDDLYSLILPVQGMSAECFEILMNNEVLANKVLSDKKCEVILHQAAQNGMKKIVQILYQKGIHLNNLDLHGVSSLHHAIYYNSRRVARYLIERGAVYLPTIIFNDTLRNSKIRRLLKHREYIRSNYLDTSIKRLRKIGYFNIIPLDIVKLIVAYL